MSNDIKIRWATRDDMAVVQKFIKDLADEEKSTDVIDVDSKVLEHDCFNEDLFKCYIVERLVENEYKTIGYAIFFFTFSTWHGKVLMLEDIYILPDYRRLGIGRKIFAKLSQFAIDNECNHIDFNSLNWNLARNFYEDIGAVNLSDTINKMRLRYTKADLNLF